MIRLHSAPLAIVLTALLVFGGLAPWRAPIVPSRPLTARANTMTVVAVGASDAFGIGTQDPRTQSWPAILAPKLGSNAHLVNLGIPGATAEVAVRAEVPVAESLTPNVIAIWLGTNDLDGNVPLATFTTQLRLLLTDLVGQNTTLLVANLPDLTLLPKFATADTVALSQQVHAWNAAIAAVVHDAHATLVDLFGNWQDLRNHPEYISGDGFHPSAAGAQRIAAIFYDAWHVAPGATPGA